MKGVRSILWTMVVLLGAASPAIAQTGRQDNSGLFVWAFLGLCAVIVAAQAIPAVLMMIGTARAVARKAKEAEPVPAESKVETN